MPTLTPRRDFLAITLGLSGSTLNTSSVGSGLTAQEASPEARIRALGITLPPPSKPIGTYVPAVQVGNLLFVSGHGPALLPDGTRLSGKVGRDFTVERGRDAARRVGMNVLASVRSVLGSLDRVDRFVKVLGMVNVTPEFTQTPEVVNGFSDLMVEIFGEDRGRAARSAVGMASLPLGIPVEVECVVTVRA